MGTYIREEKHFNLKSVKLTFLYFFQYKARCRARRQICSKLTIKTLEYVKLTKVKNKGSFDVVLASLLLTYFSSCYSVSIPDLDQLIASWG